RILWKRKLNSLHREQKLILTMIKTTQRRCFQLKEMSMAEYMAAIEQYEERLAKVGAEIVSIESKLRHPFGIKGLKALEKEEQRIREMIKEVQELYFNKKSFDIRVYHARINALIEELAKIEELIALELLKRALCLKSRFGFFWKHFYKIE
ncbi:MAG: hypothetical protein J7L14_03520, partial [Candidatus Diapherotrites archaeon]|nr:hypothetical protein [Candidatus Diapherotrites archaeon]